MLYVTTRGDRDAFTAHRTLCTDAAPDGGFFIPMHFPQFTESECKLILERSFEEIVSKILNIFFSARLTKWDVGLCLGRNTARVLETSPKILLAELWHNPGDSFGCVIDGLFQRVFGSNTDIAPSEWFKVAVKIAVLFGLYGELCRQSFLSYGDSIDLSVPADDFSYSIAALYVQEAGLPIGDIICNCTETQEVWNLIHRGTINVIGLPNSLKAGIERLVLLRLNSEAVDRLLTKRSFTAGVEEAEKLKRGLFCVISGTARVSNALNSIYSTTGLIVSPTTALCVVGLRDYRAKMRGSKLTLILEEDSPALFADQIENATGISKKKLLTDLRE